MRVYRRFNRGQTDFPIFLLPVRRWTDRVNGPLCCGDWNGGKEMGKRDWCWSDTDDPKTVDEFKMPDGSIPMPPGCTRTMQLNDRSSGDAILTCFDIDVDAGGPGWGSVVPDDDVQSLILAAPDLLSACERWLRIADANGFGRPGEPAYELLTTAIAKAKGGA
jgi:hypothetical protein